MIQRDELRHADLDRLQDIMAAFVTRSPDRVSKTKLMKLLYFFELHAMERGCPVIGLEFRKDKFGAVCYGAFDRAKNSLPELGITVEEEEIDWVDDEEASVAYYFQAVEPSGGTLELSEQDDEVVEFVLETYGSMTAKAMGEVTKQLPDWDELDTGEVVLDPEENLSEIPAEEARRISREISHAEEQGELIDRAESEVTA